MIRRDKPIQPPLQQDPIHVEPPIIQKDNTEVVINTPLIDLPVFQYAAQQVKAISSMFFVDEPEAPDAISLLETIANDSNFHGSKIKESAFESIEQSVDELLNDTAKRKVLIEYFNLNSSQNIHDLVSATGLEAGYNDYREVFPVGATFINRALSNNILKAARTIKKNGVEALKDFKPMTINDMVMETNQFAISKGQYRTNSNRHKENPDRDDKYVSFPLNNQVVNDLLAGQVNFTDWEGNEVNTSDFYFFHKASFHEVKLKTPNGHRFAKYASSKESSYPILNSFNRPHINWNH